MRTPGINDGKHQIMPQVFSDDTAGSLSEDQRRRAVAQTAVAQKPAAAFVSPANNAPPEESKKAPDIPAVIDRLHKESGGAYGGYVFVGPDHDASEADQMPPSNPGWRTNTQTASNLNDAYQKASTIKGLISSDARVAIIVLGAQWKESLTMGLSNIDLIGLGRPRISGQLTIGSNCQDARVRGMEVRHTGVAINVLGGPVLPMPGLIDRLSPIQFEDVWAYGPVTGLEFAKYIYARNCIFIQTELQDSTVSDGAVIGHAAGEDPDWTVFDECKLRAYESLQSPISGVLVPQPRGFALRATARTNAGFYVVGQPGLTGQIDGVLYYTLPHSGMLLRNCEVDGTTQVEGWTVEFNKGRQCAGIEIPEKSGGVVVRLMGFSFSPGGGVSQVPARVFFDHTKSKGSIIADFIPDPLQHNPLVWGGHVNFRHSLHVPPITGAAGVAFINRQSVAEVSVLQSATNCTNWIGGGISSVSIVDSQVGVSIADLYDPYTL